MSQVQNNPTVKPFQLDTNRTGLLLEVDQHPETGKYSVHHYGYVKGIEYMKFASTYMFDTQTQAFDWGREVVAYQKKA